MLNNLAFRVIELSLTASVLIGLLLLMVPLLQKRYRVQCRYVIWIIIAIRLLLPLQFIVPIFSVDMKLPDRDLAATAPNMDDRMPQEIGVTQPEISPLQHTAPAPIASESGLAISPADIIGLVWVTGVFIFLLIQICSYRVFLRKLQRSYKEDIPEFMKEAIRTIAWDMGLKKLPEPVITSAVGAPVLIGLLHPHILLPPVKYSAEEIRFILHHELSHYQRKDMWYKLVLLLANALHWFNPLIYLMFAQAARDIEVVCDDHVTRKLDYNERIQYANTILLSLQRKGRGNPMFSTQFRSSKQSIEKRLGSIFDFRMKRRGIVVLCLIVLCTLFGTSMVSFAYADPDTGQDQKSVIDDLLVSARDVDGKWTSASSLNKSTWEKQITAEIKWLDKVYKKKKSNFVISEILPVTEASKIDRVEYLYENSKVFRKMSKMNKGVFQVINGQSFSGFGPAYENDMVQRTAVWVDTEESLTLDMNYKLSQGKIAVWLVNPGGETVYQGTPSANCKEKHSYPGAKGLWSVIMIADSEDMAIEGSISIKLLTSDQASQQSEDSQQSKDSQQAKASQQSKDSQQAKDSQQSKASIEDDFFIERLGKHTLSKGDVLKADLQWDGKGHLMLLYTENELTDSQILIPLQGIQGIPNYDGDEKDFPGITFNFSQSPESPLIWKRKITKADAGTFYFYLLHLNSPGNVTGSVSIQKADATIDTITDRR